MTENLEKFGQTTTGIETAEAICTAVDFLWHGCLTNIKLAADSIDETLTLEETMEFARYLMLREIMDHCEGMNEDGTIETLGKTH